MSEERIREDIGLATVQILEEEKFLLTLSEREKFIREIQDEVFGLGPLEPLLQDPSVSSARRRITTASSNCWLALA